MKIPVLNAFDHTVGAKVKKFAYRVNLLTYVTALHMSENLHI